MKLRDLHEETIDDYVTRLTKTLKIPKLGSGYFAHVFQHPTYTNVVVKLIVKDDPEYLKYAKFCLKNPNNKYLPNIIEVVPVHLEKVTTTMVHDPILKLNLPQMAMKAHLSHIIFMEKLKKASRRDIEKSVKGIAKECDLPWGYDSFIDFDEDDWVKISSKTKDKDLKQFAKYAAQNHFNDIHDGNVMLHPDGHLVFTDPVTSEVQT